MDGGVSPKQETYGPQAIIGIRGLKINRNLCLLGLLSSLRSIIEGLFPAHLR